MTLANVPVFSGPYTATAGQTTFAYTFKIFADSDAELVASVDGAVIATTEYTVTGVGNPAGGDVIFNTGLTAGQSVLIEGQMDVEQLQAYTPGGKFPASSHELALDRLVRMVQMLLYRQDRFLSIGNAGLIAQPPFNALLPSPSDGVLRFENGVFSWVDNHGLPDQSGQSGELLTTDGASAFWQAFVDFFPSLQPGQFLSNNGAALQWAVPAGGGGSLPDQTGHAGKVLGTTGAAAVWQTLEQILPSLVAGRVLGNDGADLLWQLGLPTLPPPPPANEKPVLHTDGAGVSWQNLLPPFVADRRLGTNGAGDGLLWLNPELPAAPSADSLLRYDVGGGNVQWIDEAPFVPNSVLASTFTGADDTAILQNALDSAAAANQWLIIDRSFSITSVNIPSNSIIWMVPAIGISAAAASPPANNGLFNCHDTAGIRIYGNGALIDGVNRFATGNSHHGIDIAGAGRVIIHDLRINRCSGDAIHIGPTRSAGAAFSSNIEIAQCSCTTSNGNGIRVTSGRSVIIEGGLQSANGVAAAAAQGNAGVALIPNAATHELQNITVRDVETQLHAIGAGIHLDLNAWNDTALGFSPSVTILRHLSRTGDLIGFNYWGMRSTGLTNNGVVSYVDGRTRDTLNQSISVDGMAVDGPETLLVRPNVVNPNTDSSATAHHRTGIFVGKFVGTGGGSTDVGRVRIIEPSVTDMSNPVNTDSLILVRNLSVGNQLEKVSIENPVKLFWLSTLFPTRDKVVLVGRRGQVELHDGNRETVYTASADEVLTNISGNAIYTNDGAVSRLTYTLSGSFFEYGPRLRFEVTDAQPLRIIPPAGVRIIPGGGDAQSIESRVPGSRLWLQEDSNGDLRIVDQEGPWHFASETMEIVASITGVTSETILYQRQFAANALVVGDLIDMLVAGDVPTGTGTNTLRFKVNGTVILSDDVDAGSTESWHVSGKVLINTATTAQVLAKTYTRVDRWRHECVEHAIDITMPITLAITVQNSDLGGLVTRRITTCEHKSLLYA